MSSDMHINKENYELFFLDYLEGKLEENLRAELMLFLEENPELARELEGLDEIFLAPGHTSSLPLKEDLKKKVLPVGGIDSSNVMEKLVASLEGDLSAEEESCLEEFLRLNPAYHHDRELFRATVLQPEKETVFPGKERLKRRTAVMIPLRWRILGTAAAALIVFLLGWRILMPPVQPVTDPDAHLEMHSGVPERHTAPVRMDPLHAGPVAPSPSSGSIASGDKPQAAIAREASMLREAPVILDPKPAAGITVMTFQPVFIQRYYTRDVLASLQAYEEEPPSGTLIGRVVRNLGQKAKQGRELLQGDPGERERNLNFWTLADLGIQGYNKLADREVEMEVVRDKTGRPREYSFSEGERMILSREAGQP